MKTVHAIFSKGPDDFGVWLENFAGVYGAGETPSKAFANLEDAIQLYAKHNPDTPTWLKTRSYRISITFVKH